MGHGEIEQNQPKVLGSLFELADPVFAILSQDDIEPVAGKDAGGVRSSLVMQLRFQ